SRGQAVLPSTGLYQAYEAPPVVLPRSVGPENRPVVPREKGPARIEAWKRHLLDLSLNNRLLKFRESAKTLQVLVPNLARLEDRLVDGATLLMRPTPDITQEGSPRDIDSIRRGTGEDVVASFLREELEQSRLCATLPPDRL